MVLSNLAEPDWLSLSCNKAWLHHVVCVNNIIEPHETNISSGLVSAIGACSAEHIFANGQCFHFLRDNAPARTQQKNFRQPKQTAVRLFAFIFDAVSAYKSLPFLLFVDGDAKIQAFKFQRQLSQLHLEKYKFYQDEIHGYLVYQFPRKRTFEPSNTFLCNKTGSYISVHLVCDGVIDCPLDISDEGFCVCHNDRNHITAKWCKETKLGTKRKLCSPLYYMTVTGHCHRYILESSGSQTGNQTENIHFDYCDNTTTGNKLLMNDLVADCNPTGQDEPELISLLKKEHFSLSCLPYEIPCREGHSKCFNITDICVYKINKLFHMVPCRNGGHLEKCRNFECNMMFKCKSSYCIPWAYVCDGKWDCPHGNDESENPVCGSVTICKQMFKCRNTKQTCFVLGNLCDGKNDCLLVMMKLSAI